MNIDDATRLAATQEIVWRPDQSYIRNSNIQKFMELYGFRTLDALLKRANEDPAWFWDAALKDMGIEWYQPYTKVLDTSQGIEWAKWFTGGKINLAHNCLDKHALANGRRDKACIVWEGEDGAVRLLTYRDLFEESNRLANGLRTLGIQKGDRVGIFMPMIPELVVAVMALAKIGAIFTPIFSGYGAQAAAARLNDCEAKLLVTADGFYRRGNRVAMKRTADEAVALSPSVKHVLVVRRIGGAPATASAFDVPWTAGRDVWYHDLISNQPTGFPTERLDAEDPFMIIYTSGTTGRPKGAVHVHSGFPLKGAQDMWHCFDIKDTDTMFWLTDMGWMMGPWLILGTLTAGATMLLYEGTPDFPQPDRLWSIVERHKVSILGISPTVVRALMPHGNDWVKQHDLSSLRILGSTGEPWNPEPYMWYFEHVGGKRCPVINYSGGTEIAGGIVCCFPNQPLKACSFNGPVPGMSVDVVDENGQPVRGEVGELVIRGPWPGMTRGFWKDPQRYLDTYWSRWPGVWVHGDWALVDKDGFWFIQGRSDDTIKVAGKRIGPAEIESTLVSHPAVAEAAAIGVPHDVKGEAIVGFVVLKPGFAASEELRETLKDQVATQLGKPLRPEEVKFVRQIPKTRNAKVLRRVIRARYLGRTDLGDLSSLENPDAVDEIGRAI